MTSVSREIFSKSMKSPPVSATILAANDSETRMLSTNVFLSLSLSTYARRSTSRREETPETKIQNCQSTRSSLADYKPSFNALKDRVSSLVIIMRERNRCVAISLAQEMKVAALGFMDPERSIHTSKFSRMKRGRG